MIESIRGSQNTESVAFPVCVASSYGFIESDSLKAQFGGRDAFFHRTKLPEGVFEALHPGMPVRPEAGA